MIYVTGHIWVALVAAVLFGAVVGGSCATETASSSRWRRVPGLLLGGVLAAATVVSGRAILPGREGLWLDIGLILFAGYLFGCAIGCLTSRLSPPALPAPSGKPRRVVTRP